MELTIDNGELLILLFYKRSFELISFHMTQSLLLKNLFKEINFQN